jgi:hypothetical protein
MPALRHSDEAKVPPEAAMRVPAGSLDVGRVRVQSAQHRNHRPEGRAHTSSARKAAANRQNALKSTGPKTPDGKAVVRLNALRHGLLAEEILLPGEEEEALRELAEDLRAELQPVGELEALLVDRITSLLWRLRWVGWVEAGVFIQESYGDVRDSHASTLGLTFIRDGNGANAFSKLSRYETTM